MQRISLTILTYILRAVVPYFIFSWLLLSVILFVQQAGRYSDLLFNTTLPGSLVWQLTIALIPSVLSFTCPIAVLVGTIIGLSRMQGDSEMVAVRSAGVGNLQITIPLIILGLLLSSFAFYINIRGVPIAARIVRQVALQAALYKLESPIEPGVFNTEINGYTIYVKNGDIEAGSWENIFIYQNDLKLKQVRLITSKNGRIDSQDERSEIVLENASVTTFEDNQNGKIISENVEDLRLVIQTKRGEIIEKLSKATETPEEMGLQELAAHIKTLEGTEKREAQVLFQRRIILSLSPLIFSLLGTALVLKFNRGGSGFGILLAFGSLIIYYLITLISEQLARVGTINVITAGLIPVLSSLFVISWLFISKRLNITRRFAIWSYFTRKKNPEDVLNSQRKRSFTSFGSGILDFDIILNLSKYYLLTLSFIISIYTVFTAFERWKLAATTDNGTSILISYLLYLIPFIYIQISPSALMISALTTFTIKSKKNELVTWTAAGRSIYRLLLPCLLFMLVIGAVNFALQEFAITKANRLQDTLLEQLRNRNSAESESGVFWIASENRIYSFENYKASDNDKSIVNNLTIYEFTDDNSSLSSRTRVSRAVWDEDRIKFLTEGEKSVWNNGNLVNQKVTDYEIDEKYNPLGTNSAKTTHLTIPEIKNKIEVSQSEIEKRNYRIALQKKYSTIVLPFTLILLTVPFALSLKRRGSVLTLCYAIAFWLLYMGITNTFEQFGHSGQLSPALAVWSPLCVFTIIGFYLISKIRT